MRLTDEDFTGVKCPDGTSARLGYSMTEAEWKETSDHQPSYFYYGQLRHPADQPGWLGCQERFPLADGCIKVDGYQYVYNNSDAGLISPELDLSKNGGKITINVDLWVIPRPSSTRMALRSITPHSVLSPSSTGIPPRTTSPRLSSFTSRTSTPLGRTAPSS